LRTALEDFVSAPLEEEEEEEEDDFSPQQDGAPSH
jgi:hypothetical protein